MDRCCSSCGKTDGCSCAEQNFTVPTGLDGTFFASLIPIVDQARDIQACLGLRTYTVYLVWTQWSGSRRGEGVEAITREEPLLPVPKVSEFSALGRGALPIGAIEEGGVTVSEISARYTEGYLTGGDIADNEEFYYEIRIPGARRRRFYPVGTPSLSGERVEWSVRLNRAYEDRDEQGNLPPG